MRCKRLVRLVAGNARGVSWTWYVSCVGKKTQPSNKVKYFVKYVYDNAMCGDTQRATKAGEAEGG